MICVAIGRGRHRHMIAEHRHLAQAGAKLVELRLDYINGPVNIRRLLRDRPCPAIVTCRREADGGKFEGDDESRLMLLREAIAEGVEYVDLEDDIATKIQRFGQTKRIVSYHDFRKTPDDLTAIYDRIAATDPDIVKIATMAHSPHDNLRMLRLIRDAKLPVVGMCMGDIGIPSRILAGRFGAPFTYATFHHERALAPGQLSYEEMVENYHYDHVGPNTEVYGVIADPIGHSLSPLVHNALFREEGIDAVYVPFRVPSENLAQFIQDAPEMGLRGLSVTIPHKEAIGPHLKKIDPAVKGIKAVNTVVFKNSDIVGYNTDYKAALDSLEDCLGGRDNGDSPLAGKTALVLGAGGAARAVAFALHRCAADVVIAGRTPARAQLLAEEFGCRAVDWDARYGIMADVLVNCTPVGMHPEVDTTPYDKRHLRPTTLVFDTVYNPESTLLIKQARSQSCPVVTGVEMFVRQACWQFFLFTGKQADPDLARDVLKRAIGPVKY